MVIFTRIRNLASDIIIVVVDDIRTPQGMSDVFYTTSGVRQGCILAPALFCCAIDCDTVLVVLESMLATFISPISTTLMTQSFLLMIQRNDKI